MLPQYIRLGTPTALNRRSVRSKEKILILLLFVTLAFICFGGVFYLPDNFGASDKVIEAVKRLQNAGPEIFIPAPPVAEHPFHGHGAAPPAGSADRAEDSHALDRSRFRARMNDDRSLVDHLEKPQNGLDEQNDETAAAVAVPAAAEVSSERADAGQPADEDSVGNAPELQWSLPSGEDADAVARERRNKVREMAKHAWDNYKLYAWGKNELRPLTKRAHSGSIFGAYELGATIIDSLDSLYIMGLRDEYQEARDWVARKFAFDMNADLSVFETNIRFVGGFLTMYALTGDAVYKEKAQLVADKLLPAFDTPTGIPNALVNIHSGTSKNYGWASGGCSILSEFGTLHLEFSYLSDITGNPEYRNRVIGIRNRLDEIEKPNGLYPNYLNPKTGKWGQHHISLGALGDSYYEYLLKVWLQSGRTDAIARRMYDDAMDAIVKNIIQTSASGLVYASDMKYERLEHKMDHLACFAGGLFALGASTQDDENTKTYMDIGKNITNTCHESYIRTNTRLGPEAFRFSEGAEAKALRSQEKYYILRPETYESYFILWRLTHDQKYRDWGWDAVQAIERYCRSPGGFSGIKNVYVDNPQKDDVQQSFFIAESLKYLYLLFSDDSLLPLDQWVFNTEAHVIPIEGNPMYRRALPLTNLN